MITDQHNLASSPESRPFDELNKRVMFSNTTAPASSNPPRADREAKE